MTNNKLIFVFCGMPGSGKNTCTAYLQKKYNAAPFSFTTMLADALKRFYLDFNRDNLIKMSEGLRDKFGEDLLAKTMAKDVESATTNMICIDNARRIADVKYLSQLPGFILIEVTADIRTRYERVIKRGEKKDDSEKTFEKFVADNQRSTEISIIELAKKASETIDNSGTVEELQQKLDTLVKKYS